MVYHLFIDRNYVYLLPFYGDQLSFKTVFKNKMYGFGCPENFPPREIVRVSVWFRISVRIRAGGQFSSEVFFLEPWFRY